MMTKLCACSAMMAIPVFVGLAGAGVQPADAIADAPQVGAADTPDGEPSMIPPPERPKWSASIAFGGRYDSEVDFDDGPGSWSVSRVGGGFDLRVPVAEKLSLTFRAISAYSSYDFDDATGIIAGTDDPFDDSLRMEIGLGVNWRMNERSFLIAAGNIASDGESGSDFSDTITGTGLVVYQYQISATLGLGAGVIVSTELEGDVNIIPIPAIRWQFAEKWTLETRAIPSPLHTEFLILTYKHSDAWSLGMTAGFERWQFRLDEDGPQPDGVATDSRIPIAAFARWTPNRNASLIARVGAHFGGELEIDNSNGDRVSSTDFDSGLFFGLGVRVRF